VDELQKDIAIRVLAKLAKKNYREALVLQRVSELLREDVPAFAEIVADTRMSHEIEVQAALFDALIDAKIPPSSSDRLEQAIQKALEEFSSKKLPN